MKFKFLSEIQLR